MSLRAKLTLVLKADSTVVAETEDEKLWHQVLEAVMKGSDFGAIGSEKAGVQHGAAAPHGAPSAQIPPMGAAPHTSTCSKLTEALGIEEAALVAACDPTADEPYLHLDENTWEAFNKAMPERGRGRVSAIQLAGTLLLLWGRFGGFQGQVTQAMATAVLGTIGLKEMNPSRSIKNCAWLQSRSGGVLQLNPSKFSTAAAVARAYCLGGNIEWPT